LSARRLKSSVCRLGAFDSRNIPVSLDEESRREFVWG
jgi:hypothetical protein